MFYWSNEANYWETRSIARPLCDSRATCIRLGKTISSKVTAECFFILRMHNSIAFHADRDTVNDTFVERIDLGAVIQLIEYRTRNQEVAVSTHTRSTASNLEQVANLLCAQANSASYPQRDGKWVVATATGESLVWLIGAMVCLPAAPWVQLSVSAGNGWPHNALRHYWLMPISCHFRDCKALQVTSLTHVSGL